MRFVTTLVIWFGTCALGSPASLAVDKQLYWVDSAQGCIKRSNLDGTDVQAVIPGSLMRPYGVAIDFVAMKVYWSEAGDTDLAPDGRIRRANLDGSEIEDLVTVDLWEPRALVLDSDEGKLYWVAKEERAIRRSNLDGTEIETLYQEGEAPEGIALYSDEFEIFWTDPGVSQILRGSVSGGAGQDVLQLGRPTEIDLDPAQGYLYWTDSVEAAIRRATLNGANPTTLVGAGLVEPYGIMVDADSGRIYWSDSGAGRIFGADSDGGNVAELVIDAVAPRGIAMGPRPCVDNAGCPGADECTEGQCINSVCHQVHRPAGSACGNGLAEGPCDAPDTCDGSGECAPNFLGDETECRPAAYDCDAREVCTGLGPFCPPDYLARDGASCPDDGDPCTHDGCLAGVCQHAATNTCLLGCSCPDRDTL